MTPPSDRHASLQTGVCSAWATGEDIPGGKEVEFDEGVLDQCLLAASDILFELSGSRWAGACQDTVRPVLRALSVDYGRPVHPGYAGGGYGYWPAGASYSPSYGLWMANRSDRGGQTIPEITLGAYPLTGIVSVTVDGVLLDPSLYRIDDDAWLVRVADSNGVNPGWPSGNAMDLAATEVGTWEVVFNYGVPPPPGGVIAAGTLGYQLALSVTPKGTAKCRLPQRVTQVTRQGVTAIVLDPMAFLKERKTGLYEVDLWLSTVNPGKASRAAHVLSPDIGRRVRRTGL